MINALQISKGYKLQTKPSSKDMTDNQKFN